MKHGRGFVGLPEASRAGGNPQYPGARIAVTALTAGRSDSETSPLSPPRRGTDTVASGR